MPIFSWIAIFTFLLSEHQFSMAFFLTHVWNEWSQIANFNKQTNLLCKTGCWSRDLEAIKFRRSNLNLCICLPSIGIQNSETPVLHFVTSGLLVLLAKITWSEVITRKITHSADSFMYTRINTHETMNCQCRWLARVLFSTTAPTALHQGKHG